MKTKEMSEAIGVNPTTIQRWTKYFKIDCDVTEQGHFLYTEKHLQLFKKIKRELDEGKRMRDINLNERQGQGEPSVPTKQYEAKLEKMLVQVDALEEKLATKADDVVSYQLLKHRSELDEMMKLVGTLEDRLLFIEKRMMSHHHQEKQVVNEHTPKKIKRGPWRSFMNLFAF